MQQKGDLIPLEYENPSVFLPTKWKIVAAGMVLGIALFFAIGVTAAEGSLMVQFAHMKGVRSRCGTGRATCQAGTIQLGIPLALSMLGMHVNYPMLSFLRRCVACSEIIGVVSWITGMVFVFTY